MATEGVRALLAGFLWPLAARRALLRASSGRGRLEAGGMASGLPGDISGLAGAAHSETRAGASAWALPGGVSCRPPLLRWAIRLLPDILPGPGVGGLSLL